jgi:hypothetical protein
MNNTRKWVGVLVAALLPLAACDVFKVESPGKIPDDNLNSPDAVHSLVTGMSFDLAEAMDDNSDLLALASKELWHGGSYSWGDVPRGIILPEDVDIAWASMMQAQWVTEHGIERLQLSLTPEHFATNADVARAYLLGGFANRLIGENVCETVIDGGAPQSNTVEFTRGIEKFNQAITIGTAAGATQIVRAAHAGKASLLAWTGDWDGAVAEAQLVPDSMVYSASLKSEGNSNTLAYETHDRYEYTVYSTEFANHPNDPRAPWEVVLLENGDTATGANGSTPMYQQLKYNSLGDDIPLVKGTEMLVLRAEAALRNDDVTSAIQLMNQARNVYGMDPLAEPTGPTALQDAWDLLHYERGATVWLENRRFWDERRWFEETGPAHFDFLADRPSHCVPISKEERNSNPNIPAGT